jgi:RNA methyltransferase, TrmH family
MVQEPNGGRHLVFSITSSHNAKFKHWQSLLEARGIKKAGKALVSGRKLVAELVEQIPSMIDEILLPPKTEMQVDGIKVYQLSGSLFKTLDVIGTKGPIAVVAVPSVQEWKQESPRGLELIVSLSDPSNLGALIRSAEAFGVRRVVLTRECASPFLPKAIKASALSCFRVQLAETASIQELQIANAAALDMSGQPLPEFKWPKDICLVLGEEGQGLPEHLQVKKLKIPMHGRVESLNATVAASLAMYSYASTRQVDR